MSASAILDHLCATDWVPGWSASAPASSKTPPASSGQQLGRSPTDKELADHLKLSPAAFRRLHDDARPAAQVSLTETRFTDDSGRTVSQADLHADPRAPDPVREAQHRNIKEFVTRGLNRTERLVVILYYYEHMTNGEIGLALDLTEFRVSQMHTSIISQLKARLRRATARA